MAKKATRPDQAKPSAELMALRSALTRAVDYLTDAYALASDTPEKILDPEGVTEAERLVHALLQKLEDAWPTVTRAVGPEKATTCGSPRCVGHAGLDGEVCD